MGKLRIGEVKFPVPLPPEVLPGTARVKGGVCLHYTKRSGPEKLSSTSIDGHYDERIKTIKVRCVESNFVVLSPVLVSKLGPYCHILF